MVREVADPKLLIRKERELPSFGPAKTGSWEQHLKDLKKKKKQEQKKGGEKASDM